MEKTNESPTTSGFIASGPSLEEGELEGVTMPAPAFQLTASQGGAIDAPMQRQLIQRSFDVQQMLQGIGEMLALRDLDPSHGEAGHPSFYQGRFNEEADRMFWDLYKALHWRLEFGRSAALWSEAAVNRLRSFQLMFDQQLPATDSQEGGLGSNPPAALAGFLNQLIPTEEEVAPATEAPAQAESQAAQTGAELAAGPTVGGTITEVGLEEFPDNESIEARFAEDFRITDSAGQALYVDTPFLLQGLGWRKAFKPPMNAMMAQMRSRSTLRTAFTNAQANPEDAEAQTALQTQMTAFESGPGAAAREFFANKWLERAPATPESANAAGATFQGYGSSLTALRDALFPDGTARTLRWNAFATEQQASSEEASAEAPSTEATEPAAPEVASTPIPSFSREANRARFVRTLREGTSGRQGGNQPLISRLRLPSSLRTLSGEGKGLLYQYNISLTRLVNQGLRGTQMTDRKAGRALEHLNRAIELSGQITAYFTRAAAALESAGGGARAEAARIRDTSRPLLSTETQNRQTVRFQGNRMNFQDHVSRRFTAHGSGFNSTSRLPNFSPQALPSQGETANPHADEPSTVQNALQVYDALRAQGAGASESKILSIQSAFEGRFTDVQGLDRARFTWGFIQFTGGTFVRLLRDMRANNPQYFRDQFENYGITITDNRRGNSEGNRPQPTEDLNPGRNDRANQVDETGVSSRHTLTVYDHSNNEWVTDQEAFAVIQHEPRYQMLFASAGQNAEVQAQQMLAAKSMYVDSMRNLAIQFQKDGETHSETVSNFANNEVVMFGLISRRIGGGYGQEVGAIQQFVQAQEFAPSELAAQSTQDGFQGRFASNFRDAGTNVHWDRPANMEANAAFAAHIGPLSSTSYT